MGVEVEGRCENILAPVCSSIGRVGLLLERSAMHLGTEETTRATFISDVEQPAGSWFLPSPLICTYRDCLR